MQRHHRRRSPYSLINCQSIDVQLNINLLQFTKQKTSKLDEEIIDTRQVTRAPCLMLNAHLPTGSRQLAISPTAD